MHYAGELVIAMFFLGLPRLKLRPQACIFSCESMAHRSHTLEELLHNFRLDDKATAALRDCEPWLQEEVMRMGFTGT